MSSDDDDDESLEYNSPVVGHAQSGDDQMKFVDSRFGEILQLVPEYAVIQDFPALMYSESRSWSVRQPSATEVIEGILIDKERRTPVNVIETSAKLVPFAMDLFCVGVSPESLASALAADFEDEKLFQEFHMLDYEVNVAASLDLSEIVIKKQFKFVAAKLAGFSSGLCLVCSELRSDIKQFANTDALFISARRLGMHMPKQLALRECISRASESVMFGDPSDRFVKKLVRGDTALDQVNSDSMHSVGTGSTEPRQ